MPQQDRLNIAVFIDFDNIEIGVKSTLGEHFDVGTILEALKERGEVVTKIAYADWTRAGEYSRALTQHAIRLVQRNLTPGGDKNGADINLALDALEMVFTHQHINAFVIVGGDSDFLSLVEKLKQYDKKVFVVGGRGFTSIILQRNCHEFIAYENLMRKPVAKGGRPAPASAAASPIAQAFPIVRRALKILADREVSPQTGLLKSTLLQLDSTFSERNYGATSFLDFVEKLAQAGLVQLKHSGRSVMVELNTSFEETEAETRPATPVETAPADSRGPERSFEPAPADPRAQDARGGETRGSNVHAFRPAAEPPVEPLGDNADGVRAATRLLTAATGARWPMYLRNVKQILRAGGFDERRYAFGGLIDLLRATQKEGVVRMERDRRGGLRVFQGPAFTSAAVAGQQPDAAPYEAGAFQSAEFEPSPFEDAAFESEAAQPPSESRTPQVEVLDAPEADLDVDDVIDVPPATVIDTTAELLGRASGRRPRARTAATRTAGEGERALRSPARRATVPRKATAAKRTPRKRTPKDGGND